MKFGIDRLLVRHVLFQQFGVDAPYLEVIDDGVASRIGNGALRALELLSATPEMKYTMNSGNSQVQFQLNHPPRCPSMMSPRFKLPAAMITPTSAKPMAIS